ncbi:hypothetical protein [Streptomyces pini]|uniref:Uncharacterized protein n=1 Tax=Streptomyces pini TaxID=1520580 RepID=A0A1I4FGU6_9ACTN|nr:hypothetical protein [Streptomyces pini]SFL17138.1 hypothetical protein SAMN05192584_11438 [Streptomyces pini]
MRGANWTHAITVTGTALAAVAAIGGLWAQAVTSYWTQQTAEDQLSQSKEENVRQVRDQASKVTYWGGGGSAFHWGGTGHLPSSGDGSSALHVLNRSPDPIPAAHIAIEITKKDPESDHISRNVWVISLNNIPPCTHIEYPQSKLHLGYVQPAGEEVKKVFNEDGIWAPVAMHITDTRGRQWRRTQTSLKEGPMQKVISKALEMRNNIWGADAETHKAESCSGKE